MAIDLYSGKQDIHSLAELGSKAYTVTQEHEHKESFDYYKHRVLLGIDEVGEPIHINMHQARHILILANTGGGKSWIIRGLMNRFANAGGSVAIPTDTKPEYFKSSEPLQKRFHRFLLRHEKPTGYPVKTYRPLFLTKLTNMPVRSNETLCQMSLQDMTQEDLLTLMDINELTDQKKVAIEMAFQGVRDGEIWDIEGMCKTIEKNDDISSLTSKSIMNVLRNLDRMGVIGTQAERMSFIDDLRQGEIPIMNLKGALGTGRYDNYASTHIAVLMRQMLDAKAEGIFPQKQHLLIVLDELNRYMNGVAGKEILRALDTFRQERGMLLFSTQDISRIPQTVLEQCRYVLLGHNVSPKTAQYIIKMKAPQKDDHPIVFNQDVSFLMGSMKVRRDGSRDWLLIDDQSKNDPVVLRPVAPLSATREEGD